MEWPVQEEREEEKRGRNKIYPFHSFIYYVPDTGDSKMNRTGSYL